MNQLTPDTATVLLNALLPPLDVEHQTTKRVIAAIPAQKWTIGPMKNGLRP